MQIGREVNKLRHCPPQLAEPLDGQSSVLFNDIVLPRDIEPKSYFLYSMLVRTLHSYGWNFASVPVKWGKFLKN